MWSQGCKPLLVFFLLGIFTSVAYVVAFLESPLGSNLKFPGMILMKFVLCVIAY